MNKGMVFSLALLTIVTVAFIFTAHRQYCRINDLEQQIKEMQGENTKDTAEAKETVATAVEKLPATEADAYGFNYVITDMSVEEIYDECQNIFRQIPQGNGLTEEQLTSCFNALSTQWVGDTIAWYFYDLKKCSYVYKGGRLAEIQYPKIEDCISGVEANNICEEMDGTFSRSGSHRDNAIVLFIIDYDKASAFYDYVVANSKVSTNLKDGTEWYADVADGNEPLITMTKANTYYRIVLTDHSK